MKSITILTARQPMGETTPLEIAEALDGAAAGTFTALASLGRYYAAKIRGACALALFDSSGDQFEHATALRHLGDALAPRKNYATEAMVELQQLTKTQ